MHEASSPSASPDSTETSTDNNLFAPLFKSAPIGRLVSILCVHLARVRSPCSMAMLWMAFCHEVRFRWEHKVALPHMNQYVPGLDPSPLEMKERNRCLTTLGVKADHAAYWHGPSLSEHASVVVQSDAEFPGDHHCLVGQKLQVRWTTIRGMVSFRSFTGCVFRPLTMELTFILRRNDRLSICALTWRQRWKPNDSKENKRS
jgi:hypothetical protein